jgi:hypothetical protein
MPFNVRSGPQRKVFQTDLGKAKNSMMWHQAPQKSSAFDNAGNRARGQKSLLDNYLTDSIHVKC